MKPVSELKGVHAGEIITIFGKGPSLDYFPRESFDGVGICISQAMLAVPQAEYYCGCNLDVLKNLKNKWLPHHKCLIEPRVETIAWEMGADPDQSYSFTKRRGALRDWDLKMLVDGIFFTRTSTAQVAVCLAVLMGASQVILVGCDGGTGRARCTKCKTNRMSYDRIRSDTTSLLSHFRMPYVFWTDETSSMTRP